MSYYIVIIPGPAPGSQGGYWVEGGPFATYEEAWAWREKNVLWFGRIDTYPDDQGGAAEAPIVEASDEEAAILAVCPDCFPRPLGPGEKDLKIYISRALWNKRFEPGWL
jgi:hypothetical protein